MSTLFLANRIEAGSNPTIEDIFALRGAVFDLEDQARALRHLTLVASARLHYLIAAPLRGVHPYIANIGLKAVPEGVRQDEQGWLVVPAYALTPSGKAIVGCERISPDGRQVQAMPGLFQRGATFEYGDARAALTVICLDIGSALVACDALPQAKAVVCFDDENLKWVAGRTKGSVIVIENEIGEELVQRVAARRALKAHPYATPHTHAKAVREEIAGRLMQQVKWVA